MEPSQEYMYAHVSIDCAIFGFDGNELNILLIEKEGTAAQKLPGSLIYQMEDTDSAAGRVLGELTGIRKMSLRQFRCFSAPDRAMDPDDVAWLEKTYGRPVGRLITIAYLSLCRINRTLSAAARRKAARWCPVSDLPAMPFDHNRIAEEALCEIRQWTESEPAMLFELLPVKFTMAELRALYEAIYLRRFDIRNFCKKIARIPYIVRLDEKQTDVAHRAAHYYKFDRIAYNQLRQSM